MPLKYAAPARSRERIVVFGMEGVGKTRCGMHIASMCNSRTIWMVETDNTYDEFLESPNFNHLGVRAEYVEKQQDTSFYKDPEGTIVLLRVRNWDEYCWAMDFAFENAERDDWIIVDNITNMWDKVQAWYTTEAYGKSVGDFALQIRQKQIAAEQKGAKKGTVAQEMFTDWGAINPIYGEHVRNHIINAPCHLLIIAMQKRLDENERDKDAIATFGPYGVKPAGQKAIGQDSRSVILLTKDNRFGDETYLMTTCKDREREKVFGQPVENFVMDYLVKLGGWKPVVG